MQTELRIELDPAAGILEIPWQNAATGTAYLDLRATPAGVDRIEDARRYRGLRNFLLAVNGADSLFATLRAKTWQAQDPARADRCEFCGQIEIAFAAESLNFGRDRYDQLLAQIQVLLSRESASETLLCSLCLRAARYHAAGRLGFLLVVVLSARGQTPEQAELRWSLGLAHVQQAILFCSRTMRQQLGTSS